MKNDIKVFDGVFLALMAAITVGIFGICLYTTIRSFDLEEKRLATPQPAQVIRIEYVQVGAKP